METIILLIIFILCFVSLYFCMRGEVSFYKNLYNETDEIAGKFHKLATDAIKHAEEVLDSNKKLIKDQEDLLYLIDLFLFGIDDEVADVMNEQIRDRGLAIKFYEGKWRLFVKRDK